MHHSLKRNIIAIPAVKVSTVFDLKYNVYILGLNINPHISCREDMFGTNNVERSLRNMKVMRKLNEIGVLKKTFEELILLYDYRGSCITPFHAIDYMVAHGGFDFEKAEKIVKKIENSFPPSLSLILPVQKGIDAVTILGGMPILAQPGELEKQIPGNAWEKRTALFAILKELKRMGLLGIEAFHSQHTAKEQKEYAEMAKQLGLFAVEGSGYCGRYKKDVKVGQSGGGLVYVLQMLHQFWAARATQRTASHLRLFA